MSRNERENLVQKIEAFRRKHLHRETEQPTRQRPGRMRGSPDTSRLHGTVRVSHSDQEDVPGGCGKMDIMEGANRMFRLETMTSVHLL